MKKLFIFFIAVALIAAFSVPATADDAEWSFYGSARMATFSASDSKEMDAVHTPPSSDRDTQWDMQGNSRIGARVSAGDVGGRFEYGHTSAAGATLRLLYGTWSFGAGQLLLGQGYVPVNIFISNQVFGGDADMLNTGGLYGGRQQMIRLKFGDFLFAMVAPSTTVPTTGLAGEEVDTTLPKLELAYTFKTDMFSLGAVAGYNSVDIDTDAKDYSVDSYTIGLWGTINLGPAYIKANIAQSQNPTNYGLWVAGDGAANFDAGKVKDTDSLHVLAVAGVKLGDAINIEGGYGQISHESGVAGEKDDNATAYYVQCTIGLAPGVMIIPEFGVIDYEKNAANVKEGDTTYFGAKWQINF